MEKIEELAANEAKLKYPLPENTHPATEEQQVEWIVAAGFQEGFVAGAMWLSENQATHTKQLCVGFVEWQRENKVSHWQGGLYKFEYRLGTYTTSDLYEHYLKYLKEVEVKEIFTDKNNGK